MSIRNDVVSDFIDAFKTAVAGSTYSGAVKTVSSWIENYQTEAKGRTPVVMVADRYPERMLVEDATHIRFALEIGCVVYVTGDNWTRCQELLNDAIADLKKFADSDPTIDNVLRVRIGQIMEHSYSEATREAWGAVTILVDYQTTKGTF